MSKVNFDFIQAKDIPPNGVVAVGGTLSVDTLVEAYSHGVFPWPHEGYPMLWFCPPERGILFFDELHIPKSLQKLDKKNLYTYTYNQNFHEVIHHCATAKRNGQPGTWISPEIIQAYTELHKRGLAHSLECWRGPTLVGGIYGVKIQGVFSCESMFHLENNVSKLAILRLIEKLQSQGLKWMDVQMITPVVGSLGGRYISAEEFLNLLKTQSRSQQVLKG
mgnify:CR=1 FL=1